MRTVFLSCVFLFVASIETARADEPTTRPLGPGPTYNSDCAYPLVAKLMGTPGGAGVALRCAAECMNDFDCAAGMVCKKETSGATTSARCKPTPVVVPAPAPGGLMGRIERAPGEPVVCTIEVVGSGKSTTCDAGGNFAFEGLTAGKYTLRVTAGAPPGTQLKRDYIAPVNAGTTTYLGAFVLPGSVVVLAPQGGRVDPQFRVEPKVIR